MFDLFNLDGLVAPRRIMSMSRTRKDGRHVTLGPAPPGNIRRNKRNKIAKQSRRRNRE